MKFFKIFRVNLEAECPFWAKQSLCTSRSKCQLCLCEEAEIPLNWRRQHKNKTSPVVIDQDYVSNWNEHGRKEDQVYVEEVENEDGVYVNLKRNPEAYTGYQGQSIWGSIYRENHFQGDMKDLSLEERTLNRMISGLHTSISIHLSYFFSDNEKSKMRPNFKLFFEKVGNYPERMQNLYFLYSIMLRAFNRASHIIRNFDYDTGDLKNDIKTKRLIDSLMLTPNPKCQDPFRENELFNDVTKNSVKQQFMTYVQNISRIMNCVDCEKCKMYGKLQVYGIGTALKVLFPQSGIDNVANIDIKRNELIAFVNTFIKISQSIKFVDEFFQMRKAYYENMVTAILAVILCLLLFLWVAKKVNHHLETSFKRKFDVIKKYDHLVKMNNLKSKTD
eukprot:TRINITY_DN6060_c0_g2_i1.p1 TRINITY_DN6060_c0_g2~~TRINITY_DN6060_c0_g2_i1.p1  ORF type:complete len:389 (+),score=65.55 TRINITY_DN6060_c0_g2_i1:340-1506(+)